MSHVPSAPGPADDLQFQTVEPAEHSSEEQGDGYLCAGCQQPIESTYYAINDKPICPTCHAQVTGPTPGTRTGRLFKATLMGIGAGFLGALIWFAIRRVTNLEIGLVAILVGAMVGAAVRRGSNGRGGLGYQLAAVLITYCSIALNYAPDVFAAIVAGAEEERGEVAAPPPAGAPDAAANVGENAGEAAAEKLPAPEMGVGELAVAWALLLAVVFAISLAVPFMGGAQSIIGLLIIGFALFQAWQMNARQKLPISGPYELGTPVV